MEGKGFSTSAPGRGRQLFLAGTLQRLPGIRRVLRTFSLCGLGGRRGSYPFTFAQVVGGLLFGYTDFFIGSPLFISVPCLPAALTAGSRSFSSRVTKSSFGLTSRTCLLSLSLFLPSFLLISVSSLGPQMHSELSRFIRGKGGVFFSFLGELELPQGDFFPLSPLWPSGGPLRALERTLLATDTRPSAGWG